MYTVNARLLTDESKNLIQDLIIVTAVNSESVLIENNVGFFTAHIKETNSGGGTTVAVEYSFDGVNFFPMNTTASGALTADANLVTGLSNAEKLVTFTARMAKYMRFVFTPLGASSTLTFELGYQEQF